MRAERMDESLLIRYLLGKLNEEEQVQVEDRAFTEPEYLGALESAEADLIDAYVRKELPQSDCEVFERQFLTSPSRRNKVEFAKAFVRVTAELDKSSISEHRTGWQTLAAAFRGWHPGLQFAAGIVALACLITVSWLSVENVIMRSRVTTLESQQRDSELRHETMQRQLSEERRRAASLAQLRQPPASQGAPAIAALVFVPGISRAQAHVELLTLDHLVQIAHLEFGLEARDEFPQFRAELRTRSGTEVLTFGSLRPHLAAAGNVVSFDVPASALASGGYELTLRGLSPGQAAEDVGYYYFRVQRR